MNKSVKILLIVLGLLMLAGLIGGVGFLTYQNYQHKQTVTRQGSEDLAAANEQGSDELDINTVFYNGQEYKRNNKLKTILFLGVDKVNQEMLEETPVYGGQSDSIILFVLNSETKTTQMIQISRDSMVEISLYNADGEFVRTKKAQLCLQYAYGDGKGKSCIMTKNLVSGILYNIPIDDYLAMNVTGISTIADTIGGVTITIPEDYTTIDPSFIQGATLTLKGAQAEKYVRYRDINEFGSNNGRMERQVQFLTALAAQIKSSGNDSEWYSSMFDIISPYMVTDLDGETMQKLASYSLDTNALKVPGTTVEGEHDEYEINYDELYQMILSVFYTPVDSTAESTDQ